ncbi:unnamed protein product [Rangifer tarandus platyrhynchus]|uniref:Uncharacterized protein n=2 Tax=Rangifer tarandus platyrhynchus TaxID=3082113 RepID=A0AC59YQ99_RANTA|nr:unnamed protein product [Rangifer tarandus platyrhynchus]
MLARLALLRPVRERSVPGLSLACRRLSSPCVSSHYLSSMHICVCIQNSVCDLTRNIISIHISGNILFMMMYVFSKTIGTFPTALLFEFLTRISFNVRVSIGKPFKGHKNP